MGSRVPGSLIDIADLATVEWTAVVVMDPDGRILRWNKAAEDLLGWTEAEVVGRPGYEIAFAEGDDPHFEPGNLEAPGLFDQARPRTAIAKDGTRMRVEVIALRARTSDGDLIMGLMRPIEGRGTRIEDELLLVRTASVEQQRDAKQRIDRLTDRQCDILLRMVIGQANKVIAADLGLSRRTVEAHRRALMKSLGVTSSAKAIELAFLAGLHQGD